ncbi:hypothetical protein O1611_g4451 [Lasiodiplodia mahajangana]|uniref:Uncharacterized protein n=1 Tax=Lasiodiplodia mahajangana TaxID=1108764 RepID=A0ACC2JP48_9PEZI|nr:hypothetical protein O1611_g4451 [Lasiodiplodia mahajangana]
MDDPWDWDVDRVVQEICTSKRSWHPSSTPLKLPPLDQLEGALRENEVDGEVLLTYDQTELCAELGIKILKHKSTFRNAIHDIRLQSQRYRAYRKRQASEFKDDKEDIPSHVGRLAEAQEDSALESHISDLNGSRDVPHPKAPTSESATLPNDRSQSITHEQPTKKRRMAPTLLTTEIDPARNRHIATEADVVGFTAEFVENDPEEKHADIVSDNLFDGAYLGSKSITRFDIVDFDHVGNSELPSEEDRQINTIPTTRLMPGRVIQTHRLMKRRLLRGNSRRRTRFAKSDIVPGSNNPDHDEVLPRYGDSDDDMGYDSDTWREIEAEKNEKSLKQSAPKGLTVDEINATFDRVLQQMASQWKNEKLPKYASKANRIWNDGRRFGLKDAIDRARRDLRGFEARIAKWKGTIQKNEYRSVGELESSLSSFEPSIFDREHRSWLIGILTSPSEPAKISRRRKPRDKSSKPQPVVEADEEILTSDSEDNLEDFIVDDELNIPAAGEDGFLLGAGEQDYAEHTDPDVDRIEDGNVVDANTEPHDKERPDASQIMDTVNEIEPTEPSKEIHKTPSKSTQPIFIDLTTPPNPTRHIIRYKDGKLSSREALSQAKESTSASPLIMGITDLTSAERKVANELMTIDQPFINVIFSIAHFNRPKEIWLDPVLPALDRDWPRAPYNTDIKKDGLTAYTLLRLFETYKDNTIHRLSLYKNLDDRGKQRLWQLYTLYADEWDNFIRFLQRLSDRFEWKRIEIRHKKHDVPASAPNAGVEKKEDIDSLSDSADMSTNTDVNAEDNLQNPSMKKKKKKKRKAVVRNLEATITREQDRTTAAELESRRLLLRRRLNTQSSKALGSQQGSIIVNESKRDDQGFIYIADEIAGRIKEHQIAGVRFMWDQLVVAKKRQGCLLAHTMGLGKTMQVLTLLVTIGQASASSNATVLSQIPEEMRESRTLILCPATLVNNWMDEMLSWLPDNHGLGDIFKVDAILSAEKRAQSVRDWGERGGIMIIGYNLFKAFVDEDGMREIFLERPNIIIADEAHMMKNPKAKTHVAAANFRTLSRVALTGSPLANNVEEYFSMINWVAPNYLGDIREFRAQYANPINQGLHVESSAYERRHALRMLRVLKSEVSPKVSRITSAVLKHDVPTKKEFVITVPLKPLQRQAYEMFIRYHQNTASDSTTVPVFAIHDLNLICASPSIFLAKLKGMDGKGNNKTETATLPQQLISEEKALIRNANRGVEDDFTWSWKITILLEILEQCKKLGDYVLLFSHATVILDFLERLLRMKKLSFVRLDGKTQMADRQNMVKRFNKGNIDIFLISTKAGALGLNITGANRVVIFDAQFNPQNEQQAVGRAYRIGQKKKVFVYRFICGGTFEQKLLHQAIWKMQLASRVVDKKHPIPKAPRFTGEWDMPEETQQKDLDPFLGEDEVLDALLRKDKLREGIRAVEMMDVFEEEAVEDAELSAEDVAIADKMIQENESRRSGQPLPAHLSAYPNAPDGYSRGFGPSGQPFFAKPSAGSGYMPQPPFPESAGSSKALLQPSFTRPPVTDQAFTLPSSTNNTSWMDGVPVSQPSPSAALLPMQLPGAEVHTRVPSSQSHGANNITGSDWDSLSAIQGDLSRAFATNSGFPDSKIRNQVGLDVSSALWDNIQHSTLEQRSAMKWAIMRATSVECFIQGICIGLISPQQLSLMTPEAIDQQLKAWKEMKSSDWKTKKESWNSRRRSRDPEHLQTAIHRLSTTSNQAEKDLQLDQNKSCRLDDREALQAVFERRRLKTQQKDDQEALRAVSERRKARDSPSQPSDTSKEPRLPNWARSAVRQAQIPAPSSSASPKTSKSAEVSLRPPPRTPFK